MSPRQVALAAMRLYARGATEERDARSKRPEARQWVTRYLMEELEQALREGQDARAEEQLQGRGKVKPMNATERKSLTARAAAAAAGIPQPKEEERE